MWDVFGANMHYYFVKCGTGLGQRRQFHAHFGKRFPGPTGLLFSVVRILSVGNSSLMCSDFFHLQ